MSDLIAWVQHKPWCVKRSHPCDACGGVGGFDGLNADCQSCKGTGRIARHDCSCGLDTALAALQGQKGTHG